MIETVHVLFLGDAFKVLDCGAHSGHSRVEAACSRRKSLDLGLRRDDDIEATCSLSRDDDV